IAASTRPEGNDMNRGIENRNRCSRLVTHTIVMSMVIGHSLFIAAQVESGKVVGTVHDVSGAVVAGARISVINVGTKITRSASARGSGECVVTEVPPGTYTLAAEREGFKKLLRSAFKVDVNQVVRIDITLGVGSLSETVPVAASEPLIETDSSSNGQ